MRASASPGSVGFPLKDVEIRVTDPETGRPLPAGEAGMIEIRGPNVFAGYWGMPEKTKAEFRADGFFISGDLGRIDERGYVYVLGRGKDLVITGGFNVYPKEIELAIDALPGVVGERGDRPAASRSRRGGDRGRRAATAGKAPERGGDHRGASRELAGYKLPKRVVFVDALPRNTMAKVQKNVLRERYRDLYGGASGARCQNRIEIDETAADDRRTT